MPNITKSSNHKYSALKKRLLSEQRELGQRLQIRLGDVSVEQEPDDEAAQATSSITRDMTVATIERERATLAAIEAALKRIEKGRYGVCESCGTAISDARLKALPWARLCISCANRMTPSPSEYFRLREAS